MIRKSIVLLVGFFVLIISCQEVKNPETDQPLYKPWESLGELFHEVQMAGIFPDSKTFVDCVPTQNPEDLLSLYRKVKDSEDFNLTDFVSENFIVPESPAFIAMAADRSLEDHLNLLWEPLTRSAQVYEPFSTLLPLPSQYVVPGGRFREIYYWDSYFTMIGLAQSGRQDLIKSMIDNFAHLIHTQGYIPNGNRTYFIGRSQPPFFGMMVNLYMQLSEPASGLTYLDALQKEYDFWMAGADQVSEQNPAHRRVVWYKGQLLNRYWDDLAEARPESYREDVELAHGLTTEQSDLLYRNLRAACESGWDFSTRWFANPDDFQSIRTTEILPVDLNSLLYSLENLLATLYGLAENEAHHRHYLKKAENRYNAINELFWDNANNRFNDIVWTTGEAGEYVTAASFYPQFCKAARQDYAELQSTVLVNELLKPGGLLTTKITSGQQWDAPNGWAPLQWVAVKGLSHYGLDDEAKKISDRWVYVNRKVFSATSKMMEKYDVSDTTLIAGGGEYPTQDGFGWTNGVLLGLMAEDAKY